MSEQSVVGDVAYVGADGTKKWGTILGEGYYENLIKQAEKAERLEQENEGLRQIISYIDGEVVSEAFDKMYDEGLEG